MMKPNIHPEYRTVVFHDTSVDEYFKIGSTRVTRTDNWMQCPDKKAIVPVTAGSLRLTSLNLALGGLPNRWRTYARSIFHYLLEWTPVTILCGMLIH